MLVFSFFFILGVLEGYVSLGWVLNFLMIVRRKNCNVIGSSKLVRVYDFRLGFGLG